MAYKDNPHESRQLKKKEKRMSIEPCETYELLQDIKNKCQIDRSYLVAILEAATYGMDYQRKTILQQGIN